MSDVPMLSFILRGLSENWIVHQVGEVFLNIIFAFVLNSLLRLMHGFNQASLLNYITPCAFYSTNQSMIHCVPQGSYVYNIVFLSVQITHELFMFSGFHSFR